MEKVQGILSDNIEKNTLKSIDKLAAALDTTDNSVDDMERDDNEALTNKGNDRIGIYEGKGENKVIINKKSKRKQKHGYRMKAIVTTQRKQKSEKLKPRFYCSF
jgi:hypothetical protein